MHDFTSSQESDRICNFRNVTYYTKDVVISCTCFLFCGKIFKQIRDRISFALEFTGIEWNSSGSLRPHTNRMINIVRSETTLFDFLHGQSSGKLMNDRGNHFQMRQFFRTDIIQDSNRCSVRHCKTLGEVTHGRTDLTVRATILTHDKLRNFCIRCLYIDRVLEPFFIIPHKLSATSFHFPWKRLFCPFPDITAGLQRIIYSQRTITLRIFFH